MRQARGVLGWSRGGREGSARSVREGRPTSVGWFPVVGAALAVTGCASGSSSSDDVGRGGTGLTSVAVGQLSSAAPTVEVRNEASVSESSVSGSLRTVWNVMPNVFERLQIEMNYIDSGAGVIGNGNFRPRRLGGRSLSTYLECGSGLTGPYADAYAVRMSLLVQLSPAPEGRTLVRTSIDAYAEDRAVNSRPIHCTSKGVLERQIWDMIGQLLPA
jgi:hypothetical protein